MTPKEFISSGDLELYALNELSPLEAKRVEQMISQYDEVREEFERIQNAFASISEYVKSPPHKNIKISILDRIERIPKAFSRDRLFPWQLAVAACILFTLISTFFAYTYRIEWQRTQKELFTLRGDSEILANNLHQANRKIERNEELLAELSSPGIKKVWLKGLEISPESGGLVFWNPENQQVYLLIKHLPPPPEGKQYQLWGIVNGEPVDAGVIVYGHGVIQMKSLQDASAFAVTLEPAGGSVNPTMEEMYIIGEVS